MSNLFTLKFTYNGSSESFLTISNSSEYPNTSTILTYNSSGNPTNTIQTSTANTFGNNTGFQKYYSSVELANFNNPHYQFTYQDINSNSNTDVFMWYTPNLVKWNYYNVQMDGIVSGDKAYVDFTFVSNYSKSQFESAFGDIDPSTVQLFAIAVGPGGITNSSYPGIYGGSGNLTYKPMKIWDNNGNALTITGSIYFQSSQNSPGDSNTTNFSGTDTSGDNHIFKGYAGASVSSKNGGGGGNGSNDNGFIAGGIGGASANGTGDSGNTYDNNPGTQDNIRMINTTNSGNNSDNGFINISLPDTNMINLIPGNPANIIFMYCYST
jgi:hypothetical protein